MAGGKSYTLTFLLKAAADSSYQAAFSKAKQELNSFQKEIQNNNTLLKDISGYQRQEQAVERAAAKVAEKTAALEKAKAAAEAAGNADEKLNAAQLKAEAAAKTATERLNQQQQKLQAQGAALREAGVDTDNLSQEQNRLAQSTANLKAQQEALAESQNQQIQALADMEAMAAEAYTVIQVVEKLGQAWWSCVDAASSFQYAMSATESVSGATAAEMQQLTATAKEVGATTIYTATEIAQAMEYMGLAGWSAQEMIEGIPSVANLAAGAGEDLSMVCDIVTDSMMALGYGTEDTARFCDVLAQTSRTANTNVGKMGESLKYVSSTAGALNYSIEDVATAMADLANSGIKSGMAGTSLRNILSSLADPSEEAADALDALGISLADSQGDAYGLNDVITQMRTSFSGLTQEEKVHYASMIAGKRGMAGVLALVNTTQQAYDELSATISDCDGAAKEMANTRLDNFRGSTILLGSAWDALKTSIGEAFLPVLQEGADGLTEMTNGANDFVKANQEVVVGASAAVAAFGAMAVGVTTVTAGMKIFDAVFAGTALANPAMWGVIAITAGIAGVAAAITSMDQPVESAHSALTRLNADMQTLDNNQGNIELYRQLSEEMQDSSLSAEELAENQSELDSTVQALKDAYPELLGDLEAGTEAWDLQTAAILANIDAQKAADLKEAAGHTDEYARQLKVASENYAEASDNADKALDGMRNAGNVDFEDTISNVQNMYDALSGDIQTGKVEVDFDDDSDYTARIKEIQDAFQGISGEKITFDTLADVSEQLERYKNGADSAADVTTAYKQQYSDAMGEMANSKQQLEEGKQLFLDLANAGYSIGPSLQAAGLNLGDIGITADVIGQQVASGMMTAEEAAYRYGISIDEVNRDVQRYYQIQEIANTATEEGGEKAGLSVQKYSALVHSVMAVGDETLTAEQAAKAYGLTTDELNEALEQQEDYSSSVEGAVAAVEAGYMDAETAAQSFGVSLAAMDAYTAQEQLENLQEALDQLEEEYQQAYDSALSSIQGQGSLLSGLSLDADRTKLSISDALSNMQEIESYWSTYSANMEQLQGFGLSTDFLNRYCDTSAEGVANTTDLANELNSLSPEEAATKVEQLNTAFQSMAEQEQTTATATADMETQYTATAGAIELRMQQLEQQVNQDISQMVADMNKSGQARSAGSATANAYVLGIRSQIAAARQAAAELSAAGTPTSSGSSGGKTGKAKGGFTNGPELAGEDPRYPVEAVISFNPQYREENVGYLQTAAKMLGVDMDTGSAEPDADTYSGYQYGGLTDYGTELLGSWSRRAAEAPEREAPIYMGSGSTGSAALNISYSPTVQVREDTTREEILNMLRQQDERLADKIQDVIRDMERDERRTRLA